MSKINNKPDLDPESLYFIPLGGSEQFGVNFNVYACNGEFMAVDCGIGFADERFPGIDLLLPDPSFLEERRENLRGLIVTHAHEDHVGAVAYLWRRLKCPIYTTEFTATVLRKKLEEERLNKVPVHIVKPMDTIDLGVFKVQFIPVAHSIPDTCSLVIETPHGRLLHSGDWNLDPQPVVGAPTNPEPFKAAGEKGVLAYIGDSTNAEVPGRAGSESDVAKGLEKEFKKCKRRIAVTTFSSNIGRIKTIARTAEKCGRHVVVLGRSMHRMIGAAYSCGYMEDMPEFVSEEDMGYLPDDKIVMIITGSQGEARAALAKIARGQFRGVSLEEGDTAIFSARPIPGNEKSINEVKNNLSAAGVRVVGPADTKNVIHVSGHPCRDEIAEMYQWIRPQLVVPVHGERTQLDAHGAFARECQIKNVIVPNNGSVIKLAPGKPETVDHIKTDLLALDQKRIIPVDHVSIRERRKLQYTGAVHVSLVIDGRGQVVGEPKQETIGLIEDEEAQIEGRLYEEILEIIDDMTEEERLDDHFISEELRISIRRFFVHALGIKPKTTVHVMRI